MARAVRAARQTRLQVSESPRHDRGGLHAAGTRRHRHRPHLRPRRARHRRTRSCDFPGRNPHGNPGRRFSPSLPDADGHAVDQVVVTYFAAPRSYTAEDVVEISCHGSPVVLRYALERACAGGRAAGRAGRVYAARVSQRPHRSAAGRSGSRSDRRDHAVSGAHRRAASGGIGFAAAEAGEGAVAGTDRAARSRNRFRGRRHQRRAAGRDSAAARAGARGGRAR